MASFAVGRMPIGLGSSGLQVRRDCETGWSHASIPHYECSRRAHHLSALPRMGFSHSAALHRRFSGVETVTQRSAVTSDGLEASTSNSVPKRVAIFVEPSPFTYVCGYKNRFCSTIKELVDAGCEVLVVTTGKGVSFPGADTSAMQDAPEYCYGARVISSFSVGCPWYPQLPLSLALSPRIYKEIKNFKPDLIHCTTPGLMCFAVWIYSRLLKLPVVYSYHTHLPKYLPKYNISFLVPALWALIRVMHTAAQLTLATSVMLANELKGQDAAPHETIQVWKKGVDTDIFDPKFKSEEMRLRLTNGHPEDKVMVYVGRLGAEKNLSFLKGILNRLPNMRLAFVGDGPARADLEAEFKGTKTTFLGMLHGEDLSAAYASSDIFVMPSESETLGFVVLEAMACKVPVVAVRAGGIPDIIHSENVGGFLYESGDIEKATELVKKLAESETLRQECGELARAEVSKWDWTAATAHLLNVQYPMAIERYREQQAEKTAATEATSTAAYSKGTA